MIESSVDILILISSLAIFVLTIIIALLGIHFSHVLRDISKITKRVDTITESIEETVIGPLNFIKSSLTKVSFLSHIFSSSKNKKNKE